MSTSAERLDIARLIAGDPTLASAVLSWIGGRDPDLFDDAVAVAMSYAARYARECY